MHLQRVGELRAYSTQHIKWTTEGAVKRFFINPSIPQRNTSVNCEGYVSILQRGTDCPNKVVPRVYKVS